MIVIKSIAQNTKGPGVSWAFGKLLTCGTGGIRTLVQT